MSQQSIVNLSASSRRQKSALQQEAVQHAAPGLLLALGEITAGDATSGFEVTTIRPNGDAGTTFTAVLPAVGGSAFEVGNRVVLWFEHPSIAPRILTGQPSDGATSYNFVTGYLGFHADS